MDMNFFLNWRLIVTKNISEIKLAIFLNFFYFFSFESEKVIKKSSVSMFMRGTVYTCINIKYNKKIIFTCFHEFLIIIKVL